MNAAQPHIQATELLTRLFPLHRTLISEGTRETLSILAKGLPSFERISYASGQKVLDWTVPQEWVLREAWIRDSSGQTICDVRKSNLHVVQYSSPLDLVVDRDGLEHYLHVGSGPGAVPFVTSYYAKSPGFCVSPETYASLPEGEYHLYIDSDFRDGRLELLEHVIPGQSSKEILLWTYVCHPSMANNELSGPVVLRMLADWLNARSNVYTYRIVWSVETIGAIAYMSDHLGALQDQLVGGIVLNCLGGRGSYTLIKTPLGTRWIDRAIGRALELLAPEAALMHYRHRDSDERQFSSSQARLPVVGFSKSKPGTFPEYHTSLDNLMYLDVRDLLRSLELLQGIIALIEHPNERVFPVSSVAGEPFLSNRGLYPTVSTGQYADFDCELRRLLDVLAYCSGDLCVADIATQCGLEPDEVMQSVKMLRALALVDEKP